MSVEGSIGDSGVSVGCQDNFPAGVSAGVSVEGQ